MAGVAKPMRVAVLRCRKLPGFVTEDIPDIEPFFEDDRRLVARLVERGAEAELLGWNDTGVDWNRFDLAILRSTWDYIDQPDRFLALLADIEASSCRLYNPLEAVRWNSHKSYLLDLAERRVPVVPTLRVSGREPAAVRAEVARHGWPDVVLKPAIGAGGAGVRRVPAGDVARTIGELAERQPGEEFLVQPLVGSVMHEGEWSFVFIDRAFSHALLKKPAAGDYRAHPIYGGSVELATPRPEDRAQAEAILATLPFDLLFARLDLVRIDGRLAVMEAELIEPILYFDLAPEGAGRLAAAALARLGRSPG